MGVVQFSSAAQLCRLFVTPWTAAHQASLSITNPWSLLKLMPTESVMPSNHLILCCPIILSPSIFPSIRGFSNESALYFRWPKYWSFSQRERGPSICFKQRAILSKSLYMAQDSSHKSYPSFPGKLLTQSQANRNYYSFHFKNQFLKRDIIPLVKPITFHLCLYLC